MPLNFMNEEILSSIKRALDEDIGAGDVTTNSIVPNEATLNGQIIAKQSGVIAGLNIAKAVLLLLNDQLRFKAHVTEGAARASHEPPTEPFGQRQPVVGHISARGLRFSRSVHHGRGDH